MYIALSYLIGTQIFSFTHFRTQLHTDGRAAMQDAWLTGAKLGFIAAQGDFDRTNQMLNVQSHDWWTTDVVKPSEFTNFNKTNTSAGTVW